MRSEAEMMALILQVGQNLPEVKAVALGGSRANVNVPKDCFQDYDVVYFVKDKEKLLADRSWLQDFGQILIQQTPEEMSLFPPSLGERFTFLMLFEDGNRIDLMLCPLTSIAQWQKEEPFSKVLWDPNGLLKEVSQPSDKTFWLEKPTEAQFQDCCNEFWWVSTYVVKGLWRKEYYYATDHLYEICQKELRRLWRWQVGSDSHWQQSLGKNDKYLFTQLSQPKLDLAMAIADFSNFEGVWQSLVATQKLFHQGALIFAKKNQYHYDETTAINVLDYTKQWYDKFKNNKF
ncbi:aminoglycoside 6-adenylyltransferase [Enterococcus asini]|uniref:aminoglycoside 6-adenylyltransferase n=1 Tax=Enterococcus asini TaxID=57732 RepID=UPI00288D68D2|nr:aminoglycoside 6-adenylyltransferase [Enterococcus asini]MDT2756862.1 aminoglycoside 6-adenylyltransferase [Enterococcus asini]